MVFEVADVRTWEAVAVLELAQLLDCRVHSSAALRPLFEAGGVYTEECGQQLDLESVYRQTLEGSDSFQMALVNDVSAAFQLTASGSLQGPQFPQSKKAVNECIVLCPCGLSRDLDLPLTVWRPVVQHLRNYGLPVYMLGEPDERFDGMAWFEDEILSGWLLQDKIDLLLSARLVFGVPNAWTWIATGGRASIGLFYPEDISPRRWFPYAQDHYGRMAFDRFHLQIPAILVGLRRLIKLLT